MWAKVCQRRKTRAKVQIPRKVSVNTFPKRPGRTKAGMAYKLGLYGTNSEAGEAQARVECSGRFSRSQAVLPARTGLNRQACHSHLSMRRQMLQVVKWLARDNTTYKWLNPKYQISRPGILLLLQLPLPTFLPTVSSSNPLMALTNLRWIQGKPQVSVVVLFCFLPRHIKL